MIPSSNTVFSEISHRAGTRRQKAGVRMGVRASAMAPLISLRY
nr:MAG TPA: hypothetical protein [Caudoviricetes sp.]